MTEENKIPMEKIICWNEDQLNHIRFFQQLLGCIAGEVWMELVFHDITKFQTSEYTGFLEAHDDLKNSAKGPTEDYLKQCKTQAIQHHVTMNRHHPEFWNKRNEKMPFSCIVYMYFDWVARTLQNGEKEFTEKWWNANKKKCIDNHQPHAINVIELLKDEFSPARFNVHFLPGEQKKIVITMNKIIGGD